MNMTLGDICEFKTNFEDADFWLVRKGDEMMIGKPTKKFSPDNIGVKVIKTDLVLPDFLYYYFEYLKSSGFFLRVAKGETLLKHISIADLKNVGVQFQP
jgi:restriction endonuclease S subunit